MKPDENIVDNNDLLHKMITRTDSYLNYANTKSTIIITFITALIAFVGAHAGNAIHYLNERNYPELIIIFKILLLINAVMLIIGFYHAGKSVMPYTRPSAKNNIFSFIDIIHHYPDEITYTQNIMSMDKEKVAESMISLQYNLSAGLVKKYEMHRKAIYFVLLSLVPLFICLLILLFV